VAHRPYDLVPDERPVNLAAGPPVALHGSQKSRLAKPWSPSSSRERMLDRKGSSGDFCDRSAAVDDISSERKAAD